MTDMIKTVMDVTSVPYKDFVQALIKPPLDILNESSPRSLNLLHMAVGIAGEAGELLDAIKKNAIYSKPLDKENVIEELGDLYFYLTGLMNALDITVGSIIVNNQIKLAKRYESLTYSNEAAIARADKQDGS